MLPPLALDSAGWLAPLGVAVLTLTLLRRYRVRTGGKTRRKPPADPAAAARDAVRETVGGWELRVHEAGRAAEASLGTRAAELSALADRADAAADRLRDMPDEAAAVPPPDTVPLPDGDERVRRHLRQAGYDAAQVEVLLARDAPAERRRAA